MRIESIYTFLHVEDISWPATCWVLSPGNQLVWSFPTVVGRVQGSPVSSHEVVPSTKPKWLLSWSCANKFGILFGEPKIVPERDKVNNRWRLWAEVEKRLRERQHSVNGACQVLSGEVVLTVSFGRRFRSTMNTSSPYDSNSIVTATSLEPYTTPTSVNSAILPPQTANFVKVLRLRSGASPSTPNNFLLQNEETPKLLLDSLTRYKFEGKTYESKKLLYKKIL